MISNYIELVLKNYNNAQKQKFTGHSLARVIRRDFPEYLKNLTDNPDNYTFVGSPGRGMWTFSPWVGVLNKKVTTSVQSGFYIVYLFKEDMEGVYLSLNQGMRKILEKNSDEETINILRSRASDFRNRLNNRLTKELLEEIDLDVVNSSYGPYYEAGNVYAKYYSLINIPSEDVLTADFKEFLNFYNSLANGKK